MGSDAVHLLLFFKSLLRFFVDNIFAEENNVTSAKYIESNSSVRIE
jgi:hypothetical protein